MNCQLGENFVVNIFHVSNFVFPAKELAQINTFSAQNLHHYLEKYYELIRTQPDIQLEWPIWRFQRWNINAIFWVKFVLIDRIFFFGLDGILYFEHFGFFFLVKRILKINIFVVWSNASTSPSIIWWKHVVQATVLPIVKQSILLTYHGFRNYLDEANFGVRGF